MLTGVIFGISPALRSSSVAPIAVLKEDTGSEPGGREGAPRERAGSGPNFLLLLLLICAGIVHLQRPERAANRSGLHSAQCMGRLIPSVYRGTLDATGSEFYFRQVVAKLEALPGVESVSLTTAYRWDSTEARPV